MRGKEKAPYLVIGAASGDGVILRAGIRHFAKKCAERYLLYSGGKKEGK
jgi:hypothetical protein